MQCEVSNTMGDKGLALTVGREEMRLKWGTTWSSLVISCTLTSAHPDNTRIQVWAMLPSPEIWKFSKTGKLDVSAKLGTSSALPCLCSYLEVSGLQPVRRQWAPKPWAYNKWPLVALKLRELILQLRGYFVLHLYHLPKSPVPYRVLQGPNLSRFMHDLTPQHSSST